MEKGEDQLGSVGYIKQVHINNMVKTPTVSRVNNNHKGARL